MDIYVDSSFDESKKIAGFGVYFSDGFHKPISGSIPAENNNIGEIWAIYQACILSGCEPCKIHTDSQCALMFIHNKIKPKTASDFKYKEQWIAWNKMRVIAYKIRVLSRNIEFEKVDAHKSNKNMNNLNNNIVDLLAKKGLLNALTR